jgi:alpha-L-rhamnosidase
VSWTRADGRLAVEVTVPPGAVAHLDLPGAAPETVGPGAHRREITDPTPASGPVRTVRDALDDADVWSAWVAEAAAGGLAADGAALARLLARHLDDPVTVLPALLGWDGRDGNGTAQRLVELAVQGTGS